MKNSTETYPEQASGLLLGSEPLDGAQHRYELKKRGDTGRDKDDSLDQADSGDDDSSDHGDSSDKGDSTDGADHGDTGDDDGKD